MRLACREEDARSVGLLHTGLCVLQIRETVAPWLLSLAFGVHAG